MKKIITLITISLILSGVLFAQEQELFTQEQELSQDSVNQSNTKNNDCSIGLIFGGSLYNQYLYKFSTRNLNANLDFNIKSNFCDNDFIFFNTHLGLGFSLLSANFSKTTSITTVAKGFTTSADLGVGAKCDKWRFSINPLCIDLYMYHNPDIILSNNTTLSNIFSLSNLYFKSNFEIEYVANDNLSLMFRYSLPYAGGIMYLSSNDDIINETDYLFFGNIFMIGIYYNI